MVISTRSLQVGQVYHAADSSAPIAKIEWHPWGEGGTTLMVMTVDGKLRYVHRTTAVLHFNTT